MQTLPRRSCTGRREVSANWPSQLLPWKGAAAPRVLGTLGSAATWQSKCGQSRLRVPEITWQSASFSKLRPTQGKRTFTSGTPRGYSTAVDRTHTVDSEGVGPSGYGACKPNTNKLQHLLQPGGSVSTILEALGKGSCARRLMGAGLGTVPRCRGRGRVRVYLCHSCTPGCRSHHIQLRGVA